MGLASPLHLWLDITGVRDRLASIDATALTMNPFLHEELSIALALPTHFRQTSQRYLLYFMHVDTKTFTLHTLLPSLNLLSQFILGLSHDDPLLTRGRPDGSLFTHSSQANRGTCRTQQVHQVPVPLLKF